MSDGIDVRTFERSPPAFLTSDERACCEALARLDDEIRGEPDAGLIRRSIRRLEQERCAPPPEGAEPSQEQRILRDVKTRKRLVEFSTYAGDFAAAQALADELVRDYPKVHAPVRLSASLDALVVRAYLARHRNREPEARAALDEALTVLGADAGRFATDLDRFHVGVELANYLRYRGEYGKAAATLYALLPLGTAYDERLAALALHYYGSNPCELLEGLLPFCPPYEQAGFRDLWRGALTAFLDPAIHTGWYYRAFRDKHLVFLNACDVLWRGAGAEALDGVVHDLERAERDMETVGFARGVQLCRLMAANLQYVRALCTGSASDRNETFRRLRQLTSNGTVTRIKARAYYCEARAHLAFGSPKDALPALDRVLDPSLDGFRPRALRLGAQVLHHQASSGETTPAGVVAELHRLSSEAAMVPAPTGFLMRRHRPDSELGARVRRLLAPAFRDAFEREGAARGPAAPGPVAPTVSGHDLLSERLSVVLQRHGYSFQNVSPIRGGEGVASCRLHFTRREGYRLDVHDLDLALGPWPPRYEEADLWRRLEADLDARLAREIDPLYRS